jgi:hypothetical protein
MPPLFSLLLALLSLLLDNQALVALTVAALANLAWAGVGGFVYAVARRNCRQLSPLWALALYVAWLVVFYPGLFLLSHDVWLIALVTAVVVYLMLATEELRSPGPRWGLVGGVAALCSPALAVAWGATSLFAMWQQPRPTRSVRRWLVALSVAFALASPWVIRNAVTFQAFIPTKSNLMFDAHQANVVDDDGVYGEADFVQHPFNSLAARASYATLGERAFIAQHREAFLTSVRERPQRYLQRLARRLLAVTVWYAPGSEQEQHSAWLWPRRLAKLAPLVALAWLLHRKSPVPTALRASVVLYGSYVAPYVLFAFYERHVLPLTPLCVLYVFLALDSLALARRESSPRTSEA